MTKLKKKHCFFILFFINYQNQQSMEQRQLSQPQPRRNELRRTLHEIRHHSTIPLRL